MKLFGIVCCVTVAILADSPCWGYSRVGSTDRPHPKSCRDVPMRESGVYSIQPDWPFHEPLLVYCDQDYEHGGWTVVQRRIDGTVDFDRDSPEYIKGFGSLDGEFWLGLENIYRLAKSEPHELLVWLQDFAGNTSYARYAHVNVQRTGRENYLFGECGAYSGSAGDVFCKDSGQFVYQYFNGGGYWDGNLSNLNGRYVTQTNRGNTDDTVTGLYWGAKKRESIKAVKMMLRPKAPRY